MTIVVNKYKVNMNDPDIVYIGRGSVWVIHSVTRKARRLSGSVRHVKSLFTTIEAICGEQYQKVTLQKKC